MCPRCGERKLTSEFYHSKSRKDGLSWSCKVCSDLTMEDYRQRNREKVNDIAKTTYQRMMQTPEGREKRRMYSVNARKRKKEKTDATTNAGS